jgi:murein DD-endopeptidase MepM/ murein hydrolase activator NlpD
LQIILMTEQLSAAKKLNCETRHIVAAALVFLCIVCGVSALFAHLSIAWRLPFVEERIASMKHEDVLAKEERQQSDLQALAASIGQLQAKLAQLEGMTRHFSEQTGVRLPEPKTLNDASGKGGPFVPAPVTEEILREEIEALSIQLQEQNIALGMLESGLRERMVRSELLPSVMPVRGGARLGSSFGPRIDPFGRGLAIHEGLDFVAAPGTDILAAASGVVVKADYHSEFGNMVEINHGGELITRYAHMSSLKVSVGDVVRRGQAIGILGSTGRSTGPHLHFEVRVDNVPINPNKFLHRRG